MADKLNGKNSNMIERRYDDAEIADMRKRICDMLDQQDKKKLEAKDLGDRIKELRTDVKRGYELVEGEQLPFRKARGVNDIEEPRQRT